MMGIDRDQVRMVIALFVVASVAATLLALTDIVTREPIAEAQRQALHRALAQVLPAHSNDPQNDVLEVDKDGSIVQVYPAKDKLGQLTGLAWEVVAPDGYAGSIRILTGFKPDGRLNAIRVTSHKETPGLGDWIVKDSDWLANFVARNLDDTDWRVKKDGGDFDQFTGATITPRAVVKAVKKSLEFFKERNQLILQRLTEQHALPASAAEKSTHGVKQ